MPLSPKSRSDNRGISDITPKYPQLTKMSSLEAMRNTDLTVVCLSPSDLNLTYALLLINPLVAFYDIHGSKWYFLLSRTLYGTVEGWRNLDETSMLLIV
jgi:hypothetical protein